MNFEHVTFDLPHGTVHAGGDPDGLPTVVLHGFADHPPIAKDDFWSRSRSAKERLPVQSGNM